MQSCKHKWKDVGELRTIKLQVCTKCKAQRHKPKLITKIALILILSILVLMISCSQANQTEPNPQKNTVIHKALIECRNYCTINITTANAIDQLEETDCNRFCHNYSTQCFCKLVG